mgnify:CR=1 FL=1
MDDLIKILMELMQKGPRKKGGILDTAEGVDFLGRQLTKSERGDLTLVGSKLTDASRFIPFSIRNIGRDQRYLKINQYKNDLEKSFNKTIKFLQQNPDIRLTAQQKDNLIYNLGVYRRVSSENTKLEKGIIDEGKTLEEVKKESLKTADVDELTFGQAMSKILDQLNDVKDKAKKMKEIAEEDVFTPNVSKAQEERLKRLYYGRAFTGNESRYRGLGSSFLPKLHEAGIIKLDDTIYENLKKGAHHYGGSLTFAPDPNRIWRKHFGDEIFDKLDNFRAEDGEDVFEWIKRNNIKPITVKGPKSATDYLHPVEISQLLADEQRVFTAYKNPKAKSSRDYFNIDDPNMQMDRITFHGENIRFLEESLQRLDPDAYREYVKIKPTAESPTVVPFKKDEGIEQVGKAGEGRFTKAQVLIERLKNTIKENPNDKYVQETFPNFVKEIENNPKLADDPNVQEAFGITDLSETTDQRLVEYPDGTLDFYTKGGQGGMDSVQSLMDELGISQEEALRIKQLEPEDQILEITKLRTLKDKPKKAQGGIVGLHIWSDT